MKKKVTIIGSGPGGYEAAILAAKLGNEVTVIEKKNLGGTCLNQGCIPTKVYLAAANVYHDAKSLHEFGIDIDVLTRDQKALVDRKNKSVTFLQKGIEDLFKQHNIHLVEGTGKILDTHTVLVETKDGPITVESDEIIIATGSSPVRPDIFNYDGKKVITSNELLELDSLPESIIIIGGNVIACEVGQYLSRFGVDVTIVEALDHIVPFEDIDVSRRLIRKFKKEKIKILPKTFVKEARLEDDKVIVETQKGKVLEADKILVCIGRKPNIEDIGLENVGIELDERGFIKTNEKMQTNINNIYAIGDVVNSPMLAHVASQEGKVAVFNINNEEKKMDYKAVPRCIYTDPEIAAVGKNEKNLKQEGIDYKVGTFDYKSLGKAHAINKTEGFVKILTDNNNKILGASIVGDRAADQLAELTLAVNYGLTSDQLSSTIHPHPTMSEAILEACEDVNNLSIHKH